MKTLFVAALLSLCSVGLANDVTMSTAPSIDVNPPATYRPPWRRPWHRGPTTSVTCTAVDTYTNQVFQAGATARGYENSCRQALEAAGQKCASHFGGTFLNQPAGYTACGSGASYYHTTHTFNCRISCGPTVR